ncbi:hypothetical protein M2459_001444 [Parabacteroides sp. PF5-5]|uniref:DUF4827 domain-containing protein n=1 Tax=unclassified Parabacteroides TaxID=2649774 RepID=UPI00247442B5|nr:MULTISPECIES: DUF4827 domain-containing protein [unclassified Parabacteroides]MDH6304707.1 hypothetical protein [Parabacteroides sp. PH5-39]MDH6315678.1 hypothetical protein [Parabacteroides sp. PF5-13]MDH6319339.1 hypothetical protein [Parabacteroides sp. PH5-13]MDH6323070.1 hypothetical protein [Parabacteroides sp. PH5-8]MDH6326871.1 hypothetical protein [Parabacteroides sp. PH5-41]
MKKGFNILLILSAALFALSCSKNRSYSDMLKDEKKAINRLIDAEDFEILDKYPENGVFKENQFVHLSSGLYLCVIDSGNGNRATAGTTNILCRAKGRFLIDDDTTYFDGFNPHVWPYPLEFKYYGSSPSADQYYYSGGLVSALDYVGDSSVVRLIIPFKIGSSYQSKYGYALFYDRVRFIFEK